MPFFRHHSRPLVILRFTAIAIIIPLLAWEAHGRYLWSTTGKSPSQILSRLGPPALITSDPSSPATAFNYHYLGFANFQYILHFQKNQVASVEMRPKQTFDIH